MSTEAIAVPAGEQALAQRVQQLQTIHLAADGLQGGRLTGPGTQLFVDGRIELQQGGQRGGDDRPR